MYRRRRRFGFGGAQPRSAVTVSQKTARKPGKCAACGQPFAAGDVLIKLRLGKAYRQPCGQCHRKLKGVRNYHPTCQPTNPEEAMGLDPAAAAAATPASGGAVPPPPKPESVEDATLAALVALEHAVIIRGARKGTTPEMKKQFKTFQGIKARVLRPGTPAEGEVAANLALKRIIDIVF